MNTLIFTAAALGGVRRVAQPVLGTFGTDHHGGDHHMGAHHCSSSDSPQLQRVRAVAGAGAIFAKLDAQARGEYEVAIRQIRWVLVLQAYIHRKISTKPRCDLVLWDVTTVPPSATPPKTSPAIAEPAPLMLADATKRLLPWLVAVAFFMESLDTTILNTAVPTIAEALKVAPLSMKSVLSSYTLSLAVFIPISGWMADRFGTRRVFAAAIGLFTLGSFLCGISTSIEMLVAFRLLQGVGGAMMMPVGRLTMVRTFAKSELIRAMTFVAIPGLIGPMLGPLIGGLIVKYAHWSVLFFVNIPIGLIGLYLIYRQLPDYHGDQDKPLEVVGFLLFGAGIALLSYVLEVFGEHSLPGVQILGLLFASILLLTLYGFRAVRVAHPLLRLTLFRIRTFRASVSGGFFTRIGIGGIPFLFPLLYQVGLGFSPVESGLLMMPQAIAAMSLKVLMPRILAKFGYRAVLLSNTVLLGIMILGFTTIGAGTPVWRIVIMVFTYGFFASLQYSSMNTLVYADVAPEETSSASTISSTGQQMSISFGVASASLITALFIPNRDSATATQMVHGIHQGFVVLGIWTMLSSVVFSRLTKSDGDSVSRHGVAA